MRVRDILGTGVVIAAFCLPGLLSADSGVLPPLKVAVIRGFGSAGMPKYGSAVPEELKLTADEVKARAERQWAEAKEIGYVPRLAEFKAGHNASLHHLHISGILNALVLNDGIIKVDGYLNILIQTGAHILVSEPENNPCKLDQNIFKNDLMLFDGSEKRAVLRDNLCCGRNGPVLKLVMMLTEAAFAAERVQHILQALIVLIGSERHVDLLDQIAVFRVLRQHIEGLFQIFFA